MFNYYYITVPFARRVMIGRKSGGKSTYRADMSIESTY